MSELKCAASSTTGDGKKMGCVPHRWQLTATSAITHPHSRIFRPPFATLETADSTSTSSSPGLVEVMRFLIYHHQIAHLNSGRQPFHQRPRGLRRPKADLRTIQRPTPSDSTEHGESTITLEEFERVSVLCQSEFPFQGLGSRFPCVVVRRADLPMTSIQRL